MLFVMSCRLQQASLQRSRAQSPDKGIFIFAFAEIK